MAQADVDLLATAYDEFRRGDIPAVLEKVDPEVVTERAAPLPDAVVYHGHEGLLRSLTEWTEDFEDFDLEADELFDEGGGRIVARVTQRARGKGSGAQVEGEFWFVHETAGGKLLRLTMFADRDQAFALAAQGR